MLLGLLDYNSWYASPNKASNRPFQPGLEPNSAASDATVKRPELAPAEAGTLVAVRSVPGRRSLGQIVRMLHRGIESPKRQRDRSGVQTKRGVARGLCPGIRNLSDCEPDPYHSPILNRIPRSLVGRVIAGLRAPDENAYASHNRTRVGEIKLTI